jgi:iron complex outermembrane receptor protein
MITVSQNSADRIALRPTIVLKQDRVDGNIDAIGKKTNLRHLITMLRNSLFWPALLFLPCPVVAATLPDSEADFLDDLPVVLTASRIGLSPLEAPAPVTVIDRETIRASGFTEIQDVFRLVPGFLVADPPFDSPFVVNHGLGDPWSRRLQVLIDGSSIFDPLLGGVNWEDLPLRLDDIERIEVVRAPNPSSYGANAFQGVVNIITRTAYVGPSAGVTLRLGHVDIADAYAYVGRGDADMDWRVSVSRRGAQNYRASEQESADSQYDEHIQRDVLNAQLTWRPGDDQEVRLQFGLTDGEDENLSPEGVQTPAMRVNFLQAAWRKQYASESDIRIQYYHYGRKLDHVYSEYPIDPSLAPYPELSIDASRDVSRDDLEIQQTHAWSTTLKTMLGGGIRHDQARSDRLLYGLGKVEGKQWQVFGTVDWQAAPRWSLHAGGMVEKHYNTDTLFSPRLAANYRINPQQALRFVLGKGYRAPTIFEAQAREAVVSPTGVADIEHWAYRNLKPESVGYFDFGYMAHMPKLGLNVDARLFHNHYTNFIDEQSCIVDPESQNRPGASLGPNCPFDPPAGYDRPLGYAGTAVRNDAVPFGRTPRYGHYKAFYFFNSGDIDVKGADFSLDWKSRRWGRARLTHALTRIQASGLGIDATLNPSAISKDLDFEESAPNSSTSLIWSRALPWWDVNADLSFYRVGKMKWPNGGSDQPAFKRLDLKLTKPFGKPSRRNEIALTVQNLNNEHIEFRDYLVERRAFVTLQLAW